MEWKLTSRLYLCPPGVLTYTRIRFSSDGLAFAGAEASGRILKALGGGGPSSASASASLFSSVVAYFGSLASKRVQCSAMSSHRRRGSGRVALSLRLRCRASRGLWEISLYHKWKINATSLRIGKVERCFGWGRS